MKLDPKQQEAVDLICTGKIGIITGGPGTGKTTCLRAAVERLQEERRTVQLLAPTGKAARRMSEACGREASTIHRALGFLDRDWDPDAPTLLEASVVLVDEASMLDTDLAAWLFDSISEMRTSIFFIGDIDQLPSIGPGYVLGDLIATGEVPVVRLETLHRAAQESWVCRNAPRILAGDFEALELDNRSDFAFVRVGPKTIDRLVDMIELELNETQRVLETVLTMEQAFEQTQVLIPQRRGPLGVNRVNALLQSAVQGENPGRGWEIDGEVQVYEGDKVMQTKNDYQLRLMNGEQGIVAGTRRDEAVLVVEVDGRTYAFNKLQALQLQLSYATTIHKAQGSQWPNVIVVCHSAHSFMLTRQLLYTAVTRAQKRLVICGDEEGIKRALRTNRVQDRQTGLKQAVLEAAGSDR